jgi:hypothetical protein
VEQRRGLWTNAGDFSQIEYGFRGFGRESIPRIKGPFFKKLYHFPRDRLTDARNLLQACNTFFGCDLFQWGGPDLDCFRCIAIRPQPERIVAADLHQRGETIEAACYCVVIHQIPNSMAGFIA